MTETMYAAPGIGLAANQVGVSRRVCIVDVTAGEERGNLHAFINPVIWERSGNEIGEEGCLSFPDVVLNIDRALQIVVDAIGSDNEEMRCCQSSRASCSVTPRARR